MKYAVSLSELERAGLTKANQAYVRNLVPYIQANRHKYLAFGRDSGTAVNFQNTLGAFFSLIDGDEKTRFTAVMLNNGCLDLQCETYFAIRGLQPAGWRVDCWRIGVGLQHNAVLVSPRPAASLGRPEQTLQRGYMFDAHMYQKPLVFRYQDWIRSHRGMHAARGDRRVPVHAPFWY